jgi:hypothetical protein
MTTAQQVLDFEGARLGQGGDETWAWYPLARGTAWCMAFQSMALTECGISIRYAWVSACFDDYRRQGRTSTDIRTAQPGDLVAFEWGSTPGGYDHVAMIIGLTATGAWTRNGNVNGSKVADLWFPFDGGGMAEIARPPYETPIPPAPTPEEEDMKRYLLRGDKSGEIYLADAGLGWKWHIPAGQLQNVVWVITQSSGGQFLIPGGANTLVFEGQTVWVADQAFVDAIPTI